MDRGVLERYKDEFGEKTFIKFYPALCIIQFSNEMFFLDTSNGNKYQYI